MKRKVYQRPTTTVVKLQHMGMLMVSGFNGGTKSNSTGLQDYTWQDVPEE